tara:strand:+ start:159 stop:326 length:168 start_codon:yes stop_codon:yes gene_type:complete
VVLEDLVGEQEDPLQLLMLVEQEILLLSVLLKELMEDLHNLLIKHLLMVAAVVEL